MTLRGRIIVAGVATGEVLYTDAPLLIYRGIDPADGTVKEKGHPLEGKKISGKILVFPEGKGSTVGSYTLLQLAKNNTGPVGIINATCEPIIATGAIISKIPCVDKIEISLLKEAKVVSINGAEVDIIQS